jgi:hypothetical protein
MSRTADCANEPLSTAMGARPNDDLVFAMDVVSGDALDISRGAAAVSRGASAEPLTAAVVSWTRAESRVTVIVSGTRAESGVGTMAASGARDESRAVAVVSRPRDESRDAVVESGTVCDEAAAGAKIRARSSAPRAEIRMVVGCMNGG